MFIYLAVSALCCLQHMRSFILPRTLSNCGSWVPELAGSLASPFSWKGNWSNEKWNVLLWSRGLLGLKPGLNSTFLTPNPAASNCASWAAICLFPTCLMPDTIPCWACSHKHVGDPGREHLHSEPMRQLDLVDLPTDPISMWNLSYWIGNHTHGPCIARQILNCWTTSEIFALDSLWGTFFRKAHLWLWSSLQQQ